MRGQAGNAGIAAQAGNAGIAAQASNAGTAGRASKAGTSTPAGAGADQTAFQPLAIGAGGWVTGISISDNGATRLIRTDTGGGYYWDGHDWIQDVTSTSLPAADVHPGLGGGVLAVAVAPSDAAVAYMAYDNGLYVSHDGARTWTRVLSGVSTEPNDDFRSWGSRLAVDPRDPRVVYYGSQLNGLYVTSDGGATWSHAENATVPYGLVVNLADPADRGSVSKPTDTSESNPLLASGGITAISFDATSRSIDGRTATVYLASYGRGVYRSTDGGSRWSHISPPQISAVEYMRTLPNGDVLVTAHSDPTDIDADTQVWRLSGTTWTQLQMPGEQDWHSIAADPTTPGRVAVMGSGGYLAVSDDDGTTWVALPRTVDSSGDVPWLAWALNGGTNYMSPGEMQFDPVVPGRLWLSEGTGVWYADLDGPTVHWISQSRGIEQLVGTDVVVPPGGDPLVTAWDRPIFRSVDPQTYPSTYGPTNGFSGGWDLDWSSTDPNYVVASVASPQWPSDPRQSGYSTNGGQTWAPFPTIPDHSTNAVTTFGFGTMAVSAPGNIVWVPSYGKRPEYTLDGGKTWKPIVLPGVTDYSALDQTEDYIYQRVIAADRVKVGTFYLFAVNDGVYRTTDGGAVWTRMSSYAPFAKDWDYYNVSMQAVPGEAGNLFQTPGPLTGLTTVPLMRSIDGGADWTEVSGVTGVAAFGFGKAFPGSSYPAIYIAGYVEGRYGIYRSDDDAASWTLLTQYPDGETPIVQSIAGDMDVAGRVYLSITGSGWVYGELRARP